MFLLRRFHQPLVISHREDADIPLNIMFLNILILPSSLSMRDRVLCTYEFKFAYCKF
jgi:hypothetical protein